MIESKSVIGMSISESNLLETINIRDVCNCLSQFASSKKSMVWSIRSQLNSSDYDKCDDSSNTDIDTEEQKVSPNTVLNYNCSKEEGFDSTIEPIVIIDEQRESYLEMVVYEKQYSRKNKEILPAIITNNDRITLSKNRNVLNTSLQSIFLASFKSLIPVSTISTRSNCHNDPDSPNIYPYPSRFLSSLAIQLIIDYFRYGCSPLSPSLPTSDVHDIIGCDPIELDKFFYEESLPISLIVANSTIIVINTITIMKLLIMLI